MYKYTDKYMLLVLVVVSAMEGGWKGVVGSKTKRWWWLPLMENLFLGLEVWRFIPLSL